MRKSIRTIGDRPLRFCDYVNDDGTEKLEFKFKDFKCSISLDDFEYQLNKIRNKKETTTN